MISAKTFMKTFGVVGIGVYGGVTVVSVGSLYVLLRTGTADAWITTPLQYVLGDDSTVVQDIKTQLGNAQMRRAATALAAAATSNQQQQQGQANFNNSSSPSTTTINWAREGMYLGIASVVDSIILPLKLGVCLPLAREILKRRG